MHETKIIYSQKLAGFLMNKGFVLIAMEKDKNINSNRNIFLFNKSEKLEKAISCYLEK
jgi:hypothetical protein